MNNDADLLKVQKPHLDDCSLNSVDLEKNNESEENQKLYNKSNPQISIYQSKVLNPFYVDNNFKNLRKQIQEQIILKYFNDEFKNLELKFEEMQSKYEQPVLVMTDRCIILFSNPLFCFMTKQNAAEILGENISIFLEKSIQHDHQMIVQDLFQQKEYMQQQQQMAFSRSSSIRTKQDKCLDIIYTIQFNITYCEGIPVKYCTILIKPDDVMVDWSNLIIHPNNQYQFIWTMMMLLLIFSVAVTTPYNLVFALEGEIDYFENFGDIVFICDILVNFNVGQILPGNKKHVVMDRPLVAQKQLTGDFALDFLSSFPFNQFSSYLPTGDNIQMLKMLKFIRFFRLIKVSKVFKGLAIIKKQIKSPEGRWLDELVYQFQGTFKLLEMICYLFLMSHYYACIFVTFQYNPYQQTPCFFETTQFLDHNLDQWMKVKPWLSQRQVLNELVATCLNQSRVDQFNNRELSVDLVWAIVGISFFSLTIGNASQQILLESEDSIKFKKQHSIIDDLVYENGFTDDLSSKLRDSLNKNQFKLRQANLGEIKKVIDPIAQFQLLEEIFDPFKKAHSFFQQVDLEILVEFEKHIKFLECTENLFHINKIADEMYFVLDGKIKLLTRKYSLIAEYEKNSIIGVGEFLALWRYLNTEIKLTEAMSKIDFESIQQDLEQVQVDEDNVNVFRQQHAKSVGKTTLMVVNYENLIPLCQSQPEFLYTIEQYSNDQRQRLTRKQVTQSVKKQDEFMNSDIPQILFLPSGIIYLCNKQFLEKFKGHDIVGFKIFKFLSKNGAFLNDFTFNVNNENIQQTYKQYQYQCLINIECCEFIIKKLIELSENSIQRDKLMKHSIGLGIKNKLTKMNMSGAKDIPSAKLFDQMCVDGYILKFKETTGPQINMMQPFLSEQRNKVEREVIERSQSLIIDEESQIRNGDIDLTQLIGDQSKVFKIRTNTLTNIESEDEENDSPEQKMEKWYKKIEEEENREEMSEKNLLEKFYSKGTQENLSVKSHSKGTQENLSIENNHQDNIEIEDFSITKIQSLKISNINNLNDDKCSNKNGISILDDVENNHQTIVNHLLKDNKSTEQTDKEIDHDLKSSKDKENECNEDKDKDSESKLNQNHDQFTSTYGNNEIDVDTIYVQNIDENNKNQLNELNSINNGNINSIDDLKVSSQGNSHNISNVDEFNLYNLVNHEDLNPKNSHLIGFKSQKSQQSINSINRDKQKLIYDEQDTQD